MQICQVVTLTAMLIALDESLITRLGITIEEDGVADIFEPKNIIVTGGCGFIGSNFVHHVVREMCIRDRG